jgi:hypothetical protein
MSQKIKNVDEKLAYYRRSAAEAEQSAHAATDSDMRLAYLAVQRTWIYLADELEREMALNDGPLIQADEVFVPRARADRVQKSPS